jgi:hypothetical protein
LFFSKPIRRLKPIERPAEEASIYHNALQNSKMAAVFVKRSINKSFPTPVN